MATAQLREIYGLMCIVVRKHCAILNVINVYSLYLKYIIVIWTENNILSYQAIMLQEAHMYMYLEDGLYRIHPLHENQIF